MIYKVSAKKCKLSDTTVGYIERYARKFARLISNYNENPDLPLLDIVIEKHKKKGLDPIVETVSQNHETKFITKYLKTPSSVYYKGKILLRLPKKPLVVHFLGATINQAVDEGFTQIFKELETYKGKHLSSDSEYFNHDSLRQSPLVGIPKSKINEIIDSKEKRLEEVKEFKKARKELAEIHIKQVTDNPKILKSFLTVPRHEFVSQRYWDKVYFNIPLPIGEGQVTTMPSLIALMINMLELKGDEKILEVGTGSGYQTALLSFLAKRVYTIERLRKLAKGAKERLKKLGYKNVQVFTEDGSKGLPQHAPYDAIVVTAATSEIPETLEEQLKEGGRLVIPIKKNQDQILKTGTKKYGKIELKEAIPVMFVPLLKGVE